MDTIITEKLKRRKKSKNNRLDPDPSNIKEINRAVSNIPDDGKKSSLQDSGTHKHVKDPSISALVHSVKTKTKNYYRKKPK